MRLLVCGTRKFGRRDVLRDALDHIAAVNGIDVIIEGCANGPDRWAEEYAAEWGIAIEHYPADWARNGKAAGHMRNAQMLREGRPDHVVAFWDGRSSGTGGTIKAAEKLGITLTVYRETGERVTAL